MDDEQLRKARERASILMELGDLVRARTELTNILAARPDDAEAHAEMAVCFSRFGNDKKAVEHSEKVLALAPDWEHAHYIHAFVLYRSGRNRLACLSIDRAIELYPEYSEYWALKSDIKLSSSRATYDKRAALKCADQGLEFDPQDVHCHYARAYALKSLGEKAAAKEELELCLGLAPNDASLHKLHASMMLDGRNFDGALDSYREALRLNPESESARAGLISALRAKNRLYRFLLFIMDPGGVAKGGTIIGIIASVYGFAFLLKLNNPLLNSILNALIGPFFLGVLLLTGFIFTADELFNFLLLVDKTTRSQLTTSEKNSAIMTFSIIAATACMVAYAVAAQNVVWHFWAGITAMSVFTAKLVFDFEPGLARKFMYYYFGLNLFCVATTILQISFGESWSKSLQIPDPVQYVLFFSAFAGAIFLPMMALYFLTGKDQFEAIRHIIKSRI